ncbi:MAG: carbohydrate kinase family protein [Anaerolineales bacterium]|nr:carbohydrate kinase family protein [Anaerolineales bacterium]MCB9127651.1 carbohydrate kinase family protein [Ardenticatenales bacterium]
MTKQIILVGSIAYDYLMRFSGHFNNHILPEHLERLSLSFLVDDMRRERGGVAANIGYTMGLLGGHPLLFGTVGRDFGDYRDWLTRHGVDTGGVVVLQDLFTASFFVTTDLDNRQIASFYAGAMAEAAQLSLEDLNPEHIELVVISPTAPDAMAKAVHECKMLGLPYVYDPSQQTVRLTKEELIDGIDGSLMLIVNDYELNLIEKKTGLESAEIHAMTHNLIVTRGEHGITILNDGMHHIPAALTENIVDPTGVGDAFRGGLLRAYVGGADWTIAGKVGALAATFCLENVGTQGHHYTIEEFILRFEQLYGGGAQRVRKLLAQQA